MDQNSQRLDDFLKYQSVPVIKLSIEQWNEIDKYIEFLCNEPEYIKYGCVVLRPNFKNVEEYSEVIPPNIDQLIYNTNISSLKHQIYTRKSDFYESFQLPDLEVQGINLEVYMDAMMKEYYEPLETVRDFYIQMNDRLGKMLRTYVTDIDNSFTQQNKKFRLQNIADKSYFRFRNKNTENFHGCISPTLNVSTCQATTVFHVEDMDLESINFHLYGAAKFWTCASPDSFNYMKSEFDRCAKLDYSSQISSCNAPFRHKCYGLTPNSFNRMTNAGVKFFNFIQRPGKVFLFFTLTMSFDYCLPP